MLKNFFRVALLAVAAVCALASCVDNTADYDALRPTLLGGVYYYAAFGGVDNVDAQIKSQALSKLGGYKEFFTNPFEDEDISAATLILSTAWDITDGAGLKEQLEKLKSGEGEHKAWDWARGVYIAWAGLRAGFITREEVDAYNASLVPLAQAKYADWNAYFNDFLAGRKAWDPQDESGGAAEMEEVVKDLLDNKASIYKVVPFK